jgi:signal transduction histidine kinase
MSSSSSEPLRVMRIAAWMWIVYLASLASIDVLIYANGAKTPILSYHLINALPALLFLLLAFIPWPKETDKLLTPLMILIISLAPILIYHLLDLRLPPAPLSNLEGMVLRQLPVLFIGLVLVAWHYNLVSMLLFSVGANLLEQALVFALGRFDASELIVFYFIIVIRTVCFIVAGVFINQLIAMLRAQQQSLEAANHQLAHYVSTLESLTVSRERNRMSRELHDTVVHTLSGLAVQLETAKAYWSVEPDTAKSLLDQSLEATRNGLQETRRALKELRASPLEDLGLALALRQLVQKAVERGKLVSDVLLPEQELILSPDVEQSIYRIAQEAIENVVHHANAAHLILRLTSPSDEVTLRIQDDGIGFPSDAKSPAGHFGLDGMHERAQLVGGSLTLHSKPGSGTVIELRIPGGAR